MALDRSEPDPQLVRQWFLDNPAVPDGTFELGLVLGGTVSAGAYTAGALDFLIEALDCWEAARGEADTPQHRVVVKVITGTSGGGVNAAIAARALNFEFPHVSKTAPIGDDGTSGNPFYDTWVRDLTLKRFLATSETEEELISILNGGAIDDGAANIIRFGEGRPAKRRPWLGAPLRLILTLTNLAGVPYRLDLSTGAETFVDHADYMRFAVNYPGAAPGPFRPDELLLNFGQGVPGAISWERFLELGAQGNPPTRPLIEIDWDRFSEFAKATAAFPAGFPPRELKRPAEHYRWRILPRPEAPAGQPKYRPLTPDWGAMLLSGAAAETGEYFLLAMDGGATDNEPIELGRTAMTGIIDHAPREPDKADRAVMLVDPFAGKAELGRQTAGTFVDNLGGLVNTLIQQTRYNSRDVVLAADQDVFSRFMLAPRQDPGSERPAIASAGLAAFIGFACPAFMRYDYLLGRQSCRDFLFKEFALAEGNAKVFGSPWTPAQKAKFATGTQPGYLPIIPLIGTAAQPQDIDDWPRGKLHPEDYRDAIEDRFRAILRAAAPHPLIWQISSIVAGHIGEGLVANKVIEAINDYLETAKLA